MNLAQELYEAQWENRNSESASTTSEDSEDIHREFDRQLGEDIEEFHRRIFGEMTDSQFWDAVNHLSRQLKDAYEESNRVLSHNLSQAQSKIDALNRDVGALRQSQSSGGGGNTHKIKIYPFKDGVMEWPMYKRNFITACLNNGLTDEQKKRTLQCSLSLNTLWQICDINIEEEPYKSYTWDQYLELVDQRFSPLARSVNARAMFKQAKQGANESVEKFANRIRALYEAGYPDDKDEAQNERIMIDQFVAGIYNGQHRIKILEAHCTKLVEALDIVAERLSFDMQLKYLETGKAPGMPPGGPRLMLGDGSPEDFSMCAMDKKKTSEEESRVAALKKRSNNGKVTCYYCGRDGHIARECFKKKREKGSDPSKRDRQGRAGKGQRGPPMKKGGGKPERPKGRGRGYRPADGMHAIQEDKTEEGVVESEDYSSDSGDE